MAGYIGSGSVKLTANNETVTGDETVTGNSSVGGDLAVTGTTTLTGDLLLGDNDKAIFGAGSDLQIYHTGTNSVIDNNTGHIYIRNNVDNDDGSNIYIQGKSGENSIVINDDSNVELYFDNALKLATTNTGIDVTGDIIFGDGHFIGDGGGDNLNIISGTSENLILKTSAGVITFGDASPSEYARFDSSGNLLVGKTSAAAAGAGLWMYKHGTGYGRINFGTSITGTSYPVVFYNNSGSEAGSITYTTTSTSYNTSSDYRLKTDAQPMTGASARVQALKPVNFEWIADGTRVDGFLAHEAQAVVPEAVTGTKDAMRDEEYEVTPAVLDADGNETTPAVMGTRSVPDMQGIDQSKMVPLLTAALREALTKIDTMETRLAALEAV